MAKGTGRGKARGTKAPPKPASRKPPRKRPAAPTATSRTQLARDDTEPNPFDTPEKAYAEAERLIAEAKAQGSIATELRLELPTLERLPPSIAGLTALQSLSLDDTRVSDLAPLVGLTTLQTLWLDNTPVTYLAPLAGLTGLRTLSLLNTPVTHLAPLAELTALRNLSLAGTRVTDLAPLRGLTTLQSLWLGVTRTTDLAPLRGLTTLRTLSLHNTPVANLAPLRGLSPLRDLSTLRILPLGVSPVADLAPLAGLTNLQTLRLDNTRVADLAPLRGLKKMIDAVYAAWSGSDENAFVMSRRETLGLRYWGTPISKRKPYDHFASLNEPHRTIETINYLRRQQDLPEHIPAGYAPPDDPFLASLREGKVRPARGESSKEKKPKRERKKQPVKPPEVPPQRPAAVEPVERDGIITLPSEALTADLPSDDLAAALLALKNQIKRVADSARNESNPDKRVIAILDELTERIPASAPPQNELFELAHEVDTLRTVGQIVNEQWPPVLAARYHSMVLSFDRTTRQFPRWREFLRNTAKDTLTPEQLSAAPDAVKTATAELRTDEAAEFVDPRIPAIIDHLVEWSHVDLPAPEQPPAKDGQAVDPVAAGKEALIADGLESLSNTAKKLSDSAIAGWEIASEVGGEYAEGARGKGIEKLKAEARKDGENLPLAAYKWAKRYLVAGSAFAALATTFPAILGWLVPILAFFTATGVVVDKRRKRRQPDDGSSGQARG